MILWLVVERDEVEPILVEAKAKELVIATVEKGNEASKSVLLKTGFESVDGIENGEELITFRCKFPLKTPQYYREIYFKKE